MRKNLLEVPQMSFAERDRRWAAVRSLMNKAGKIPFVVWGESGGNHRTDGEYSVPDTDRREWGGGRFDLSDRRGTDDLHLVWGYGAFVAKGAGLDQRYQGTSKRTKLALSHSGTP